MLDTIKTFLEENCPLLKNRRFSVNFLGEKIGDMGIFSASCAPQVTKYADGGALLRFDFSISLRCAFDGDAEDSLQAQALLCGITDWLEEISAKGIFPVLDGGKSPRKFSVLSACAPVLNNTKTNRLQATCSFYYETKGC
ncbi:MAG: hypothetical protein J6Q27_00680 [Clostridia bacterium]|nr:hypothetical protein [Clostridia bacterium]